MRPCFATAMNFAGPARRSITPASASIAALSSSGIAAVVEEYEFLGGVVRYRLRMGNLPIVVEVPHRRDGTIHAAGSAVGVVVDPRQVAVLR